MTTKNCSDCPSCITTQQGGTLMAGADTCHRFGYVLSRPNVDESVNVRIKNHYAASCDKHGEPRPGMGARLNAQVAAGDPDVMSQPPLDPNSNLQAHTCTACVNYIPPDVVKDELGWSSAMCAARGRLLSPALLIREASDCDFNRAGDHRDTTDGVILLPIYEPEPVTLSGNVGAPRILSIGARHRIDPREYPTDKPVSDEQRHVYHIRAWRKIDDPEGIHEPVFLPIFYGEELCGFDPRVGDAENAGYGNHRPDLYVDHQNILYDLAVELLELDETPVLIGGAGTGKTEIGCWLAWLMDVPFTRISISKGTEEYMLKGEGHLVVDPDTGQAITEFKLGRFSKAITKVGVVMVDEPNLKSDIFEFLRPMIDSAKQLIIEEAQGMNLRKTPATFLLCSMNPPHDPIYIGTEPMSAADIDRISPFWIDLPTPEVERAIIASHCADDDYLIPTETLDAIMNIAADLRGQIAEGTLPISWGMRPQIKVARKTKYYSIAKAYNRAILDGLEPEVREIVLTSVSSYTS